LNSVKNHLSTGVGVTRKCWSLAGEPQGWFTSDKVRSARGNDHWLCRWLFTVITIDAAKMSFYIFSIALHFALCAKKSRSLSLLRIIIREISRTLHSPLTVTSPFQSTADKDKKFTVINCSWLRYSMDFWCRRSGHSDYDIIAIISCAWNQRAFKYRPKPVRSKTHQNKRPNDRTKTSTMTNRLLLITAKKS